MRSTHLLRSLLLPPLPPRSEWPTKFPPSAFRLIAPVIEGRPIRKGTQPRVQVADEELAEEFVESFGIEEGSTVIEGYAGLGFLTRALLKSKSPHRPSTILALEPSLAFCHHSLGIPPALLLQNTTSKTAKQKYKGSPDFSSSSSPSIPKEDSFQLPPVVGPVEGIPGAVRIQNDGHWKERIVAYRNPKLMEDGEESRLVVVDDGPYAWSTVNSLEREGYLAGVKKAKWEEDSPNLHFVCQVPTAVMGEQMINQWISCIATQSWLFRFGRVKLSLILSSELYDRLIAPPGARANCKLSVIRQALCDLIPSSSAYPIGPNLTISAARAKSARQRAGNGPSLPSSWAAATKDKASESSGFTFTGLPTPTPSPWPDENILSPSHSLIYPRPLISAKRALPALTNAMKSAAERPLLMGLTLVPKKNRLIESGDKERWDYVLRRMFVQSGQTWGIAINNLGPGATNLIPLLTDRSLPPSLQINPRKAVGELSVEDWANLVRVFREWKFAPENLFFEGESASDDHQLSRTMGAGM